MSDKNDIKQLKDTIDDLAQQVGILQVEQASRKLHHIHGYYLDRCLYDEVVDLFCDDCEVRFMRGVFKGKKGAHRLSYRKIQEELHQ